MRKYVKVVDKRGNFLSLGKSAATARNDVATDAHANMSEWLITTCRTTATKQKGHKRVKVY